LATAARRAILRSWTTSRAATSPRCAGWAYDTINLGSDQPVVLMDAIRLVERLTGQTAIMEHQPAHPADVTGHLGGCVTRRPGIGLGAAGEL